MLRSVLVEAVTARAKAAPAVTAAVPVARCQRGNRLGGILHHASSSLPVSQNVSEMLTLKLREPGRRFWSSRGTDSMSTQDSEQQVGDHDSGPAQRAWCVWRVDTHGNRAMMRRCDSQQEAEDVAATFEAKGHKQGYWVEREA